LKKVDKKEKIICLKTEAHWLVDFFKLFTFNFHLFEMKKLGAVWRTKDVILKKSLDYSQNIYVLLICFKIKTDLLVRLPMKICSFREMVRCLRRDTWRSRLLLVLAEISTRAILTAERDRQEKPVFVYFCRFLTRDVKSVCPFVCPSLPPSIPKLFFHRSAFIQWTSLSCVSVRMSRYWARGKFGEHKRCVRVARGAAESNSSLLSALQTSQVLNMWTYAQLKHELTVL